MDLITQGILGAAIGQAGFQKRLGRKAMLWGAIAGLIPDLDVVIRSSTDPVLHLIHHRGFTHSLYFSLFAAPLLGYILNRWHRKRHPDQPNQQFAWTMLMLWGLVTHPLLDVFTVYGTQLLWPFSSFRFSFNAVSVVDLLYSGILLLSIFIGLFLKKHPRFSQWLGILALFVTSGYLFYGIEVNQKTLRYVTTDLEAKNQSFDRLSSYTTLLQLKWRRIVVRTNNEIWVGFINMAKPGPINWTKHTQPPLEDYTPLLATREGQVFLWFCDQEYAAFVTKHEDNTSTIILRDCRFGMPGETLFGFWGITADVDATGKITSRIRWQSLSLDLSPQRIQTVLNLLK